MMYSAWDNIYFDKSLRFSFAFFQSIKHVLTRCFECSLSVCGTRKALVVLWGAKGYCGKTQRYLMGLRKHVLDMGWLFECDLCYERYFTWALLHAAGCDITRNKNQQKQFQSWSKEENKNEQTKKTKQKKRNNNKKHTRT